MDITVIGAFESAWQHGERPEIAAFVQGLSERDELLMELMRIDWEYRIKAGELPSVGDYQAKFPDLFSNRPELISSLLCGEQQTEHRQADSEPGGFLGTEKTVVYKEKGADDSVPNLPHHVGRYRIERVIGKGGLAAKVRRRIELFLAVVRDRKADVRDRSYDGTNSAR